MVHGFAIADFTDQHDIGVLTQEGLDPFAEGETATLTLLGSGINARALASAGLPMISLGNVGSPWGASLSGTTHFLADCAQPIPEPSTYAMAALGLVGLGVWSRRKKA